jgi:ABC-type sugar transport system ATPase subunit
MTLYREPANLFVAGFIGSPGMNFIRGTVRNATFEGSGLALPLTGANATRDGDAVLGIRPQALSIVPDGASAEWGATVMLVEALGSEQIVHLAAGEMRDLVVVAPPEARLEIGSKVGVRVPPGAAHLFDAESGRRLGA